MCECKKNDKYQVWVKSDDLLAIVDFIYRGEADVFQKNLDSFLAVGGELQLIGLMGKNGCKGGRLCWWVYL